MCLASSVGSDVVVGNSYSVVYDGTSYQAKVLAIGMILQIHSMHMQQHCNSGQHRDVLRAEERELNRNTLAEPEMKKVQPIIIV